MTAQDRTLDQYHELMQLNAVSHLLRTAQQVGLMDELRRGQRTLSQLGVALGLGEPTLQLFLDALVRIAIIERYRDDYAISAVGRLLCQHDADLGDATWKGLADRLAADPPRQGEAAVRRDRAYFDAAAAVQWTHTPAAMQAAEILDIGGADELPAPSILDLGCGSGVWSAAMAYRDAAATVTAFDHQDALTAARHTADSIQLGDRFRCVAGDLRQVSHPGEAAAVDRGGVPELAAHDIVVLAQRISGVDDDAAERLIRFAVDHTLPGGRVVVIDLFRGPTQAGLAEAVQALRLQLQTSGGQMRTLDQARRWAAAAGLESVQFAFLAASRVNLGMLVGVKPLGIPGGP